MGRYRGDTGRYREIWGGGRAPRSARADCAAAPARARAPCPSRERTASRAPPAAHRRCMCMRTCMPMARASHVCRVRMAHLSHHRRTCRSCVRESPYLAASSASRSSHPHSTRGCPASKPASCFSGSRRCFCSPAMAARVSATLSSSSDGRATTARLSCATRAVRLEQHKLRLDARAPAPSTSGAPRTTVRSVFSLSCSRACSCERRGSTSSANRREQAWARDDDAHELGLFEGQALLQRDHEHPSVVELRGAQPKERWVAEDHLQACRQRLQHSRRRTRERRERLWRIRHTATQGTHSVCVVLHVPAASEAAREHGRVAGARWPGARPAERARVILGAGGEIARTNCKKVSTYLLLTLSTYLLLSVSK